MIKYQNLESVTYKKIDSGKNRGLIIRELIDMGYSKSEAEGAYKFVFRDMMGWALQYMQSKGNKPRK